MRHTPREQATKAREEARARARARGGLDGKWGYGRQRGGTHLLIHLAVRRLAPELSLIFQRAAQRVAVLIETCNLALLGAQLLAQRLGAILIARQLRLRALGPLLRADGAHLWHAVGGTD